MSTNVPPAPSSAADKPKRSPPSAEELCLRTFRSCWQLDKGWLVSFVASAQRKTPTSPISWVEFMPQGHTHLVRSALKLVSLTKALPITKIKEVMFAFVLDVLNESVPRADFFKARKAAKPRKRTPRRKGKGKSVDMAVDAPEPRTAVGGSSQEPEALWGDGDPPPLEGSSKPSAHTQHFPGPSSEESRDGGTSSEVPRAFVSSTMLPAEPVAPVSPQRQRQGPWPRPPEGKAAGACRAEGFRPVFKVALAGALDHVCPRQAPPFTPPSYIPSPGIRLPCRPRCAQLVRLDAAQKGHLSP